ASTDPDHYVHVVVSNLLADPLPFRPAAQPVLPSFPTRHSSDLARSLAASLHGWYLRWSRYGRDTPRLIAEAQEREHWIAAQWDTWRQERLAYVLHRAATRVPYYLAQWAARRRQGDHASWEVLENWPILD